MSYPHSIRLRGPWQCHAEARTRLLADGTCLEMGGELPPPARLTPPEDWSAAVGNGFVGRVRFARPFHLPTRLEPQEQVWLVVEGVDAWGVVVLNGQTLGRVEGYALARQFNVTGLLAARNDLIIVAESPEMDAATAMRRRPGRHLLPGGLIGDIRLEIRREAFLDRGGVWRERTSQGERLRVMGQIVVGEGAAMADSGPLWVQVFGNSHCLYEDRATAGLLDLSLAVPRRGSEIAGISERAEEHGTNPWLVTVQLSGDEGVYWRQEWSVGLSAADCNDGGDMSVAGRRVEWPLPLYDARRLAAHRPGAGVVGLAAVLADAVYMLLGSHGVGIVQMLPLEWAEAVAPRLARYGAIVAWAALPGQWDEVPQSWRTSPCWGRRWLAAETAFGLPGPGGWLG